MQKHDDTLIPFRTATGDVLAELQLTATREAKSIEVAPIIERSTSDASEHGETAIQLKEADRYEYEIINSREAEKDLRLRCQLSSRRRSLKGNKTPDAGLLETGSFCGTLLLELVVGEATDEKKAVATALIDVRSIKMGYRDQYRGMLRRLAEEMADLVVDLTWLWTAVHQPKQLSDLPLKNAMIVAGYKYSWSFFVKPSTAKTLLPLSIVS